jgi:ParB-like chromosome segregation protein Spo0J
MSATKKKPSALGSFGTLQDLVKNAALTPVLAQPPQPAPSTTADARATTVQPALAATAIAHLGDIRGYQVYSEGVVYNPGDRVLMPMSVLEINPRNPRVFLVESKGKELVASIATNGQMECGLAYQVGANGKFRLKSGHRRQWALDTLNCEYMKIEIVARNPNELEEYRQARALNTDHQSQTHIDDALRFAELIQEGIAADQTALAVALKVSKPDMSKSLSIAEMPRLLLEPMAEHIESFGMSSAYAVYRYWAQTNHDEDRTLALIKKVIDGRLSVRALEAMVKEVTGGRERAVARREHAVARSVFSGTGQGELKVYAAGKLTLELNNLDPERRDAVYTRIVDVFKELGLVAESGAPSPGTA